MSGDKTQEADERLASLGDAVDRLISMISLMQESMDKLDMPEDKFPSKFTVDKDGFLAMNKTTTEEK